MSCPYSTILGERGKGFHEQRILGLAQNDILGTIGLATVTTIITDVPFVYSLVGWFVAGEVLHYVYGVDSAFLEMINVDASCKK